MKESKGFFQSLFDFSFTAFITTKIIKILYGLSMVCAGLVALFVIIMGFNDSPSSGVLALLIGAPLIFLLIVIFARIYLEFMIVVFRIAEHAAEIAAQGRRIASSAPSEKENSA
jgi:hypothetical protein